MAPYTSILLALVAKDIQIEKRKVNRHTSPTRVKRSWTNTRTMIDTMGIMEEKLAPRISTVVRSFVLE